MKAMELGFAPKEVRAGTYTFQPVILYPSRGAIPMMKTLTGHATHVMSEEKVAKLGEDTATLIEQHQALRPTVPGGEAERRRKQLPQVTLGEIAQRDSEKLRVEIDEAEEYIRAASMLPTYRGDPDEMFAGLYPNVTDQYRDFDIDPDRYADQFVRTDEYRLAKHTSRPERRAEHKQERQERRRQRNVSNRRDRYFRWLDEPSF